MTTQWNGATPNGCGLNVAELFNVILVYEDRASAVRGLALYQRLVAELGGDGDFNLNVWKFAVLGVRRLAELSAGQAAEADLIIVCTRDETEPAEPVRAWFERWLDLKGQHNCALVVVGEAASEQPAPTRQGGFYHRLAQRAGVTCFPPAAPAARTDGCDWFPRPPAAPGADGSFPKVARPSLCVPEPIFAW